MHPDQSFERGKTDQQSAEREHDYECKGHDSSMGFDGATGSPCVYVSVAVLSAVPVAVPIAVPVACAARSSGCSPRGI